MSVLEILGLIVLVIVVIVVVAIVLLARSHARWLQQQSPVGVWEAETEGSSLLLQFEGGPDEGLYKEVRQAGDDRTREFGHWAVNLNELRMLIMGTDVPDHPRFGVDTVYQVNYPGPESIRIDGPDRPGVVFARTAAETTVDVGDITKSASSPSGPMGRVRT